MTSLRLLPLLLAACAQGLPLPPPGAIPECDTEGEAHDVYRQFWYLLDQQYAVFDARLDDDDDWALLGSEHCAALGSDPSDDELFDAMLSLAQELDDGHLTLDARGLGREADAWVSAYPHDDALLTAELEIEAHYLDGPLTWDARDWVAWGTAGDVGYLSLTSMDGLSFWGSEGRDVRAARRAMEAAVEALGGRPIVVDVRSNGGGWDAVSLEMASFFAGPRAIAWTEQVRNGPAHDAFTPPEAVYVAAAPEAAFTGPIAVLTSGGTFSAAETFVLAMMARDDVVRIGEPTSGHLSDLIEAKLLNRWRVTYSGERYVAADGELYEGRGIPVDLEVPFDPEAASRGADPQFEAAVACLEADALGRATSGFSH